MLDGTFYCVYNGDSKGVQPAKHKGEPRGTSNSIAQLANIGCIPLVRVRVSNLIDTKHPALIIRVGGRSSLGLAYRKHTERGGNTVYPPWAV